MFYEKILKLLSSIFGLKTSEKILYSPSKTYEVYVSLSTKNQRGSFGFWINDIKRNAVYRRAIVKAISYLKWSYSVRIKEWLKL